MTDNNDRIRIEIAFDGSQVLTVCVPVSTAEDLDRRPRRRPDSALRFEADDGRYTISLQQDRLRQALGPREPGRLRRRRVATLRGLARRAANRDDMSEAAPEEGERDQARPCARRRGPEGRPGALEELYLIHFDRIYSYLHVSVGNRHDAEDLTTQTFLKMLEAIGKFRWQSAPFSAWLFRIAHNLAMDHFRANKRWQPEEEVPGAGARRVDLGRARRAESIGQKSMLELIDDLSPEQQQVLTLKFVFNFANAEAATILGKTEGAIKSLQHRALVSLQKQLEKREATG